MKRGFTVLALLLCGSAGLAQEVPQLSTQAVSGNVHMLIGQGGNIGLMHGPDGVFLIDDQYAPATPDIIAAARRLSDQPIRFVLNTHWHSDHTGGNERLARKGSLIVAHDNVRQRLSSEQFIEAFQRKVPAAPAGALPVVSFNDEISFHINGDSVRALHVPHAHTDGDTLIHFQKANVLHMGDTFFNGMYPFIDLSSGGSINGLIAAVDRALSLADDNTRVIPGHGPLSHRAGLEAYRDMLVDVRDRIAGMLARGVEVQDIVDARPTSAFDKTLGQGFIAPSAFARTVARSLSEPALQYSH